MAFDPISLGLTLAGGIYSATQGGGGGGTPGVVNPQTGNTVNCGKQDETERTAEIIAGNIPNVILGRMGGANFYAMPSGGLPFPNGKTEDEIKVNVFAYLKQNNPGQCPAMTSAAQNQYTLALARVNASKAGAGRDGVGMNLPLLQTSGVGRDSTGGPIPVMGGLSTTTLILLGALAYLLLR